jgi:hypothetical protein
MLRDNVVSGPIKLRCPPSNDGYLVFLYEQTLVFEMRNQSAIQRVANLLQESLGLFLASKGYKPFVTR